MDIYLACYAWATEVMQMLANKPEKHSNVQVTTEHKHHSLVFMDEHLAVLYQFKDGSENKMEDLVHTEKYEQLQFDYAILTLLKLSGSTPDKIVLKFI